MSTSWWGSRFHHPRRRDRGAFRTVDPEAAAQAVFRATASFHHPLHAPEWRDPGIDAAFEGVWRLAMEGLRAPARDEGAHPP